MTFELNNNVPAGPIVCGTNLTPAFFAKAGIQSLPKGLEIHVGYRHGEDARYTIRQGEDAAQVPLESVASTLISFGATLALANV